MTKNIKDVLTDRVIGLIREGKTLPWQMTYSRIGHPLNPVSRNAYRGINYFLLSLLSVMENRTPLFVTYRQAKEHLDTHVRKGEESFPVVFWKPIYLDGKGKLVQSREEAEEFKFVLRYYNVFSIDQLEENEKVKTLREKHLIERGETGTIESAEAVIQTYLDRESIPVKPSTTPCYWPAIHAIGMPGKEHFVSDDAYYKSFFHEITHSTGKALSRPTDMEVPQYSKEELIAELGAALLCEHTGVHPVWDNSAAYLQGWLGYLENNIDHLYSAGSQAEKAANYVLTGEANMSKKVETSDGVLT